MVFCALHSYFSSGHLICLRIQPREPMLFTNKFYPLQVHLFGNVASRDLGWW